MIYESYFTRTLNKVKGMINRYSGFMFTVLGELSQCEFLTTEEHFRSVPEHGWQRLEKTPLDWGGEYMNLWVKGKAVVPEEARGKSFYARPKWNAVEGLYFLNGIPSGIINNCRELDDNSHTVQLICKSAEPGECYDIAFEAYAGHFCAGCSPFDRYGTDTENYDKSGFGRYFSSVQLCVLNEEVKDFIFDLRAVLGLAELTDEEFVKAKAKNAVEALYELLPQDPAGLMPERIKELMKEAREIMASVLIKRPSDGTRGRVGIIGHSHMDTAWLWPVKETVRKCARTYSNALYMMDQYPEYKFVQSSALHSDWMRLYYPDIFKKMQQRVKEGRYEPNGGVWVECDCNITSGELMARQFLYGQRFTRRYFDGYTADTFWLPDTFGYNAAIPQIMRESEVKYFCTTKISWCDLNRFPYDTFIWEGMDGSRVFTHFNLMHFDPTPQNTKRFVNEIKDKQVCDMRLIAFGVGDGGGGPSPVMIEDIRRTIGLPGLPETFYTTVSEFMQKLEKEAVKPPVYRGELYLELHRGTLTQMHDVKRNNRKAEYALRELDYFNVLAKKPKNEKTDDLYKKLLTNQFHDILPGTCITPVYGLAEREVSEVIADAQKETAKYASGLVGGDNAVTFFNTLPFERRGNIIVEGDYFPENVNRSTFTDICGRHITVLGGISIPAYGSVTYAVGEPAPEGESPFRFDGTGLETPFYRVRFNENGEIESLIDLHAGREARRCGGAPLNTFYFGEDIPANYDNWDIDSDQGVKLDACAKLSSREVISDCQNEFRIRSRYVISDNTGLIQDMVFSSSTKEITFHTLIDWNEKHKLLKVGFDCNVRADRIKNEMQFGYTERPTTRNNSLEAAKFEVCNHKWSDISEPGYGVALLNDCKYGISSEGSDMRLTLHRGGTHPDVTGDRGVHEFSYALLLHEGAFCAENVVIPSYIFNIPAVAVMGAGTVDPPVSVSEENVIAETVKPAEDREGAYVVRLYEAEGTRTVCRITPRKGVTKCMRVNILEDIKEELPMTDGSVTLDFGPFKLITLMFE